MTIKLNGKVEPYFERPAEPADQPEGGEGSASEG
jgi:hypothetical protein